MIPVTLGWVCTLKVQEKTQEKDRVQNFQISIGGEME